MPATSMMSVTMPASFFATGALSALLLALPPPFDTTPLAFPFAASCSLAFGARSCLLAYSDDGSRRTGVACFMRAMAGRGREGEGGGEEMRTLTTRLGTAREMEPTKTASNERKKKKSTESPAVSIYNDR